METGKPLLNEDVSGWGDTRCENCDVRLSTWADTLRGCCARCGHAFPEAFRWLHDAAIKEKEEEPERLRLAFIQYQQRRFRQFAEPLLSQYLETRQSATEPISRLEFIARLKVRTGMKWIECRDFVDQFIAENNLLVAPNTPQTAHEVFQSVLSNDKAL